MLQVELWFKGSSKAPPTPLDPAEPLPYDRQENLKRAFFDLFADHNAQPPQLDYVTMVSCALITEWECIKLIGTSGIAESEYKRNIKQQIVKGLYKAISKYTTNKCLEKMV